jgi:hypothetical protein
MEKEKEQAPEPTILEGVLIRTDCVSNRDAIIFNVPGAIDFTEQIDIMLSNDPKEGFEEESAWKIYINLVRDLPFITNIIEKRFESLLNFIPDVKDQERKIYYKCQRVFTHSHDYRSGIEPRVRDLTFNAAIYGVIQKHMSIV